MIHKIITYGNGITTANSKDPHAYRTVTLLRGFYLFKDSYWLRSLGPMHCFLSLSLYTVAVCQRSFNKAFWWWWWWWWWWWPSYPHFGLWNELPKYPDIEKASGIAWTAYRRWSRSAWARTANWNAVVSRVTRSIMKATGWKLTEPPKQVIIMNSESEHAGQFTNSRLVLGRTAGAGVRTIGLILTARGAATPRGWSTWRI